MDKLGAELEDAEANDKEAAEKLARKKEENLQELEAEKAGRKLAKETKQRESIASEDLMEEAEPGQPAHMSGVTGGGADRGGPPIRGAFSATLQKFTDYGVRVQEVAVQLFRLLYLSGRHLLSCKTRVEFEGQEVISESSSVIGTSVS
ncbi:hypothetical protein CYMTET_44872 [Cymbomonas tetramitiformis]|uniref:Uncharacterized protein n=1 Tax=Cymbomonas tetramitiformis TaxID=36881 RepID=A0AAE0C0J5_9CHLO|nr:hypothetical protein CYMTET_47033 [Cymbomonas tetramitiformis]KAK3245564.1 hypothetical protein CYMTET_44872 [Cymbomonas tetramitiformis]